MVFVLGMTLKFQKFYMKTIFANNHPFPANTRSLKHWCDMTRLGNPNDFCAWNDFGIPKIPHENTFIANTQPFFMQTLHLKPKIFWGMTRPGGNLKMQLKLVASFLFKECWSELRGACWYENLSSPVVKIMKFAPSFLFKESGSNSGGHVDMKNLSSPVAKILSCGSSKQKREAVKAGDPNPEKKGQEEERGTYISQVSIHASSCIAPPLRFRKCFGGIVTYEPSSFCARFQAPTFSIFLSMLFSFISFLILGVIMHCISLGI